MPAGPRRCRPPTRPARSRCPRRAARSRWSPRQPRSAVAPTATAAAGVRDFVGYGAANDFETAAAPGLTNTTADLRGDGPDTDNNSADFTAGTPNPRNTSGGGTPPDPGEPGLRIHDIQGAAQVSPKAGVKVAEVPGVVTTVSPNGFWFQDPTPDADPATSEGLFAFTRTAPDGRRRRRGHRDRHRLGVPPRRHGDQPQHDRADQPGGHRDGLRAGGAGADRGRRGRAGAAGSGDRGRRERQRGDHRDSLRPGQ